MKKDIKLWHGDCLELMKNIPDHSIDLICVDPPYGKYTHNHWDNALPFDKLWSQYKRIIKENGAIIIFGSGMFTADLMNSNRSWWRYNLIWDKELITGFLNANRQPLRQHEDICVFYKKQPVYNPQKTLGEAKNHSRGVKGIGAEVINQKNYNSYHLADNSNDSGSMKHPTSILRFKKIHPSIAVHPTQKSTELLEWIIKSYSNENGLVLDNACGSGSTLIAAINTNRNCIGIELDDHYYEVAKNRIEQHLSELENGSEFLFFNQTEKEELNEQKTNTI